MARIYDNIETKFAEGLQGIITNVGVKRVDHLSEVARTGIKEFTIPPEFKSSLFDFQQTAVKIAARH